MQKNLSQPSESPQWGNDPRPYSINLGYGERLILAREPVAAPLRFRLRLTRGGSSVMDTELGRAEVIRYLMAVQKLARIVDRNGLPGEGAL